jgi:hypothetical protein
MPKYVDGIRGRTTQAFPGATIGRITELLSRGKINISNKNQDDYLIKNYNINLYTVSFF